jgi:hypothetical protein
MVRSARRVLAFLVVSSMFVAACGGGDDDDSADSGKGTTTTAKQQQSAEGKVTMNPLFYRALANGDAEGGTNPVTIRIADGDDPNELRVGFTEDEVAGTGDQWRAAGWNAVTTATLLTGSPLGGKEITFDVNGAIDGPSAGALMTVGSIALLRGDTVKNDITMTGTINPDGTVGPVGGIPYKVDGVVEAKKTRMLIPTGQRNSANNDGDLIDIVDLGRRKKIEVSETPDVYDAYEEFTGDELPHPDENGNVELSEEAYQRIKAKVTDWLAQFSESAGEFNSLDETIQDALGSTAQQAQEAANTARSLSKQGLQAGAYNNATQAAAIANAVVKAGRALQIYLTQGADAFLDQIGSSAAIKGRVQSLFDELKTYKPETVSDAAALIDTYSNAIDALSASTYADNILAQFQTATDETSALQAAVLGALFHEIAGSQVAAAKDIFSVGRDLGGAKLDNDINLQSVSDFFRKAAEANLNAFDTVVLGEAAKANNMSLDAAKEQFAGNDLDYALASSSLNVLEGGLDEYMGDDEASAYAKLGGAVSLYARASGLIAKYYSLQAEFDEDGNVSGIGNQKALQSALELGKSQVERSVSVLIDKDVDPTLVVAGYESAGIQREGDASEKLDALTSYWTGFIESRVLAYLGGFPTEGYE